MEKIAIDNSLEKGEDYEKENADYTFFLISLITCAIIHSEKRVVGYLFLGISLLAGAIKGFCGKTISGKVTSMKGTFYVNVLRRILCVIIVFFVVMSEALSSLKADMKTIVITGLSGASTAVFVASWIMSVRKGA